MTHASIASKAELLIGTVVSVTCAEGDNKHMILHYADGRSVYVIATELPDHVTPDCEPVEHHLYISELNDER